MRLITKLWATLLLLCVAGVANAATEYEVDQKFTSVAALEGQLFAIVNETDGKAIYNKDAQNLAYDTYANAIAGTAYLYKLHSLAEESDANVQNAYAIEVVKADGSSIGLWGNPAIYLNSGAEGGFDGCFVLGNKDQYGTDVKYGGAWEVEYVEDQGFTLKNVARGGYFAGLGSAPTGTDPIYWTFCTLKEKAQTDPLADQKDALTAAIAKGKMFNALAYTDATFATLTAKVADGETALAAADATAESLTTATTAINDAITALALKDGFTSLKDVDFGVFDGWGATAKLTQKLDPTWDLFKATGQSYGDPSVNNRADVSAYDKLYVVAVSGTPRILLNRDADGGQWSETEAESHLIDNTKGGWSAKYFSTENGITTVDLKQLVADKGFAHLTAIKSFDNNVISGLYLYKEATVTPVDGPTIIDWVAADKYTADTDVNGVEINLDEKTTVTFAKNSGTNAKYYNNGGAIRVYKNSTITFKGEGITKIILTYSPNYTGEITSNVGEYAVDGTLGTWKGEANEIVLTNAENSASQARITKIHLVYGGVEADVEPVHIANTAETAYTVAEAVGLIDAGEALSETVFVKGIISKIEKVNVDAEDATKNYITYWISADGTEEGQQFQCFKGKTMEGVAYDDIKVGAEVIVTGTMTKYQNTTYEFNSGNTLVSYKAPVVPNPWIAPVIAGEDPVTDGQYKVMNVGSGKYLAMGKAWFSWATTAIVAEDGFVAKFAGDAASFTLTNTGNGKYVFTSGNDIQGDAMHADGANATNYGLTKLANGNYHIHDADGNAESPCWGYNSDFHATGIVAHADATAAGWNCEWIFVGDNAANLYNAKLALYNALVRAAENGVDTDEASAVYAKADATVDELKAAADKLTHATNFAVNTANAVEGADMTYTIVNPSFETGNTNGWTYEASNDHGAKENSNGTYTMANCDGKYLFNIWSSGNLISQTIEDLPNGTYKMKAIIATDADHKVQLNANDKSVQIDAIGKETGVEGELEFDVFNNKATIGAEGVNKYWYKVDNFRLTYVKGIDLSELVTTYETALANAQAVEGIMNAEVKTALETAITANSEVDKTDFNALTDAVKALTDATNAANASIAAYTNAKAAIDAAKAEMAATNVYTAEALEAYKAVYDAAEPKYENRTLTDDEANALENPKALTGWHDANIVDNLLLSAWDAEADKFEGYYINTWSIEGETDGSEFKVPFFEYWVSDDNSLGEKTLTATMNNLEAGEYDVTAWVRVRIKNGAEAPAAGITLQANDGEAVNVAAGDQVGTSQMYLKEFTATGTVAEDGILKIKFNIAADNNISWLSFKNVKFEKKPVEVAHTWDFTKWSEATVANLKADAAASKIEGWSDVEKKADAEADVEPTEASKDNCFWAVIPEGGELKANGEVIEELKGLQFGTTFAGNRSLAIAVNYAVADASKDFGPYNGPAYLWLGGAGFECFTIPAVKGGTKITMGVESHKITDARGVQLFAGETELKDADGNAVAAPKTYTEQTWAVPAGVAYDIVVKNTKGCHIYFIDAEQDEATLTSISTVKSNVMNNAIYNLNGQKVNKAQKGLFIINGKKVVK
ncbi:hypothetical protein [uncultured Prevotella sp.]|uniref:hypothetical protein n=1 Tax=uncultured Prevotella sp. TaxID=159272 RepID=UPI0025861FFE|nr:hypothetical protein [uncultured Prevotella sp.]